MLTVEYSHSVWILQYSCIYSLLCNIHTYLRFNFSFDIPDENENLVHVFLVLNTINNHGHETAFFKLQNCIRSAVSTSTVLNRLQRRYFIIFRRTRLTLILKRLCPDWLMKSKRRKNISKHYRLLHTNKQSIIVKQCRFIFKPFFFSPFCTR